jgi:hypothetical protein
VSLFVVDGFPAFIVLFVRNYQERKETAPIFILPCGMRMAKWQSDGELPSVLSLRPGMNDATSLAIVYW